MDPDPLISVIFIGAFSLFTVMTVAEAVLTIQGRSRLQNQPGETEEGRGPKGSTQTGEWGYLLFSAGLVRHLCAIGAIGALLYQSSAGYSVLSFMTIVVVLWLFSEMLQVGIKALVWSRLEAMTPMFAGFVRFLGILLKPVFILLNVVGKQISDERFDVLNMSNLLTRDGLRSLLDAEEEETNIPESEKRMITSILDLDDLVVREVMVPRIDMVAMNVETELKAALDVIIGAGHSRIPVFEGSADRIIGVLYAKDLLTCFRDEQVDVYIRHLLRPAYFVPMSKKVNSLFAEMQKQRVHMAIIVDEYGGTAGLVTIEDLIEEIVGDIQDEFDPDEDVLAELIGAQVYLLNSRLDIDALAELLDIHIDEDNADTVGGLIYVLAGHVPAQGETVEYAGWRFTILSVDGHRIEQIRAEQVVEESVDLSSAATMASKSAHENRDSALSFLISK
ncbi:MAG: hemolysin family protein [Caldilineaceae bacterium]